MGIKKHRMTIGIDQEDFQFCQQMQKDGIFKNNAEAIRWCIKFCRLYGIPSIKKIRSDSK